MRLMKKFCVLILLIACLGLPTFGSSLTVGLDPYDECIRSCIGEFQNCDAYCICYRESAPCHWRCSLELDLCIRWCDDIP